RVKRLQWPGAIPGAIEDINKGLEICIRDGFREEELWMYNELGVIYSDPIWDGMDHVTAAGYFEKALTIATELKSEVNEASVLSRMGWMYLNIPDTRKALDCFDRAMDIYKKQGNRNGTYSCIQGVGQVYKLAGEYGLALEYLQQALEMADETGNLDGMNNIYESMAGVYKLKGDFEKALEYYGFSVEIKFKLYDQVRFSQIAEMETKFDTERSRQELELKDAQLKKQNLQRNAFIAGFGLVLALAIVIFISYRSKKKANVLLEKQKKEIEDKNEELHQQNEEIAAQRDEIEAQRNEVVRHRDEIEKIHKELTDSIRYAKLIQEAMLPEQEWVTRSLPEHFILFKPKDIVSGDFYWASLIPGNRLVITAADCTGHGVPGAFMSMLGVSFLNEIINKEQVYTPGLILNRLRTMIIESLKQTGQSGENQDGMDVALCVLELETGKLEFAGANNPLVIINSDGTKEIKGDKMPVGYYERMPDFETHEFQLAEGDSIYVFSDGFPDQFGGPSGRKYMKSNFKKILQKIHQIPTGEQKALLEEEYRNWIGCINVSTGRPFEQVDDIVVIGLKFRISV
ncbi:MAG: tetratricopeptide repeat protein, partial [Bacteroidota bacterium]